MRTNDATPTARNLSLEAIERNQQRVFGKLHAHAASCQIDAYMQGVLLFYRLTNTLVAIDIVARFYSFTYMQHPVM